MAFSALLPVGPEDDHHEDINDHHVYAQDDHWVSEGDADPDDDIEFKCEWRQTL